MHNCWMYFKTEKKKFLSLDWKKWNVKNVFKPGEDPNGDWLKKCGRVWESWKKRKNGF